MSASRASLAALERTLSARARWPSRASSVFICAAGPSTVRIIWPSGRLLIHRDDLLVGTHPLNLHLHHRKVRHGRERGARFQFRIGLGNEPPHALRGQAGQLPFPGQDRFAGGFSGGVGWNSGLDSVSGRRIPDRPSVRGPRPRVRVTSGWGCRRAVPGRGLPAELSRPEVPARGRESMWPASAIGSAVGSGGLRCGVAGGRAGAGRWPGGSGPTSPGRRQEQAGSPDPHADHRRRLAMRSRERSRMSSNAGERQRQERGWRATRSCGRAGRRCRPAAYRQREHDARCRSISTHCDRLSAWSR